MSVNLSVLGLKFLIIISHSVKTNQPEETEFALKKNLPQKNWSDINTLFVTLGQNICKPINPKCEQCPINQYCEKYI